MEKNEQRRVGTLTMGITLVAAGVCMLVSMFVPALDLTVVLQASPVILISLGMETLLSARRSGKVKYDWVGMLLCFLLVCTALCLYAVAYTLVLYPDWWQYW